MFLFVYVLCLEKFDGWNNMELFENVMLVKSEFINLVFFVD